MSKVVYNKDSKQLVFDVSNVGRTKRQKYAFNQLVSGQNLESMLKYINSFNGVKQRYMELSKPIGSLIEDKLPKRGGKYHAMFQRMLDTDSNHSPSDTPSSKSNTFLGVEIECFIPYDNKFFSIDPDECEGECSSCDGIGCTSTDENGDPLDGCDDCGGSGRVSSSEAAEQECHNRLSRLFKVRKIKWVSIKGDGSIDPDDDTKFFSVEITVLTKSDDNKNLKLACQLLNEIGAKVNKSCGLHVHLDARHIVASEVITMAKKFERALPVMMSMVPMSRRNNTRYCKSGVSPDMNDYDHRYYAINTTSYKKFKTLEIRLHSGTTDFTKIMNWSNLLIAIAASSIPRKCEDINQLTEFVKISESLNEYISQRIALFGPVASATSIEAVDSDSTEVIDIDALQVVQQELNRIANQALRNHIIYGSSGILIDRDGTRIIEPSEAS